MKAEYILELLENVKEGKIEPQSAYEELKELPYRDLGFANIDNHRRIRTGFPEVVFGQGKTPEQVKEIVKVLASDGSRIIATRVEKDVFEEVKKAVPDAIYYEAARIVSAGEEEIEKLKGHIAVVTAGTADIPVAEEAAVTAELLGNQVDRIYDVGVAGIHRLFDKLDIIRNAAVIIVVAGMEGALASVVGGLVEVPVIAVPTSIGYGANLGGISALLSMLNSCANGVSVVNIDNGFGAAYTAAVINRQIEGNTAGD